MLATGTTRREAQAFGTIFMLSAWGFAIVITSFLFLYVGYLLDRLLGTSPSFMFGLFFLAVFTTVGRLYQEAWRRGKEL